MVFTLQQVIDIVDCMPGNYMVCSAINHQVSRKYYTKGIPKLSGLSMEEYKKIDSFYDLIISEDRDIIINKIHSEINNGKEAKMDILFRLFHKEKGFIWVHLTGKFFAKISGENIYIVNLLEVTKETMISYATMEASDRYICIIEKATKRFLYANQGFYDLVDSNPAQAMGKHCYELLCKVMEMKHDDNCLCYSSIDANPPLEMYNVEKKRHLTLTGREIVWGEYNAYVFFLTDVTEKKEQNAKLEDSNKRFNVALDNSDLMIWEYDMVNHRCINSEKAGRDYNIPLVIENYPESLFETGHTPPETVEQIKDVKRRLLNGESGFSVERRTVDKFGKSNWQKVDYTLECDEDGKPIRAIVCGLDITEKKELEEKYEEQMEYRNKFAQNAMFSVRLDLDSDVVLDHTSTDEELEKIITSSNTSNEFLMKFFKTSQFDENSEVSKDKLTRNALLKTYSIGQSQYKTVYFCTLLRQYLDLNLNIYKNPGSGHVEVFFVISDVTENILKQKALKNVVGNDYNFVALIHVNTGKMAILASVSNIYQSQSNETDYDTIILNFAKKYRHLYCSYEDYYAVSEGITLKVIKEKLKYTKTYEFNYKTMGENQQIQTHRLSFSYAEDSKEHIIFTQANITSFVQEEQRAQIELEKALKAAKAADQAKTDFLSRMSHDMRTPMNGIMGMTQLTKEISGISKEVRDNLDAISDSSRYLLQLINDTLDMSKIESEKFTLKPETVCANTLIEHVLATVRPLADSKSINLEFEAINAELDYIWADKVRLQQLFLNVLSNAVKFTKENGRVKLTVECLKREHGIAYDRITVEDNGRGMSKEFVKHIFEPFSQEKNEIVNGQEGTGLGMAIVKNLVAQMDGKIDIESEVGKGTKVIIYLNFQRIYKMPGKDLVTKKDLHQLDGKKILLVEDHPLNATIAKKLLEKKNMIVDHAKNGKVAVDSFSNSNLYTYDMILMDIRMPVMNGLEATRAIRTLNREDAKIVPIVAMTANAYDEDMKKAMNAGMNEHVAKPVEPEVLYDTLLKFLQDNE